LLQEDFSFLYLAYQENAYAFPRFENEEVPVQLFPKFPRPEIENIAFDSLHTPFF
jgi:hypothetical protein